MDNKGFKRLNAEGYISLIAAALFSVGVIGIGVHFITRGKPDSKAEQVVEKVIEVVVEKALSLPDNSVSIDLTPEKKEDDSVGERDKKD